MLSKWDKRFLDLAQFVSTWSRDPSTQTGAVITDSTNRIISAGFNGFSRGIADDSRLLDRKIKYEMIIHCEINAILFAKSDTQGCILYTYPFLSCSRCTSIVIQAGISRVVAPLLNSHQAERWGDSIAFSRDLFAEADVEVVEVPPIAMIIASEEGL